MFSSSEENNASLVNKKKTWPIHNEKIFI